MAKKDFMSLMKEKTVDVRPSILSAEENIKSQIIVLDQLRDLIPPLTDEELAQLAQNIRKHGVKDPLTVWETTAAMAGTGDSSMPAYVLIDGHNRYRICTQYHLDYRINIVQFGSLADVKDYMIDYQLGRRNLTSEQASYLRGMRYIQQKSMRGSNLQTDGPQVNVAETLATEYGVSSRTIKRDGEFAAGIEKLAPALKRDVLTGKQKLPKTALATLAKTQAAEPLETLDSISEKSPLNNTVTGPAEAVQALKIDIRTLANGRLDKRGCTQLLQKINELLALHPPK